MMKKAVVTGANGFIGRYFVKELVADGYHLVAVVKNGQENIVCFEGIPDVEIVYCDLDHIETLPEFIPYDVSGSVFYHFAWAGSSGRGRGDYALQFECAKGAVKAAVAAKKMGCSRIVAAGSITQLMYRDYLCQDACTPEITACYAVGKMAAEAMMKCVCTELGLDLCWTYISNFYGEDDPTENFINFLVDSYARGETPMLTSAEQLADFMYVSDVAKAIKTVGEHGRSNTSYYIGYGEPKSLRWYIETIQKKIAPGIESGIGKKALHGFGIDFEKIDYKKLSRETGFQPEISFETGIEWVINKRMHDFMQKGCRK